MFRLTISLSFLVDKIKEYFSKKSLNSYGIFVSKQLPNILRERLPHILCSKLFSKIFGKIFSKFGNWGSKIPLRILPCVWKKIRDFFVWKQISHQLLGAWSSYLHHLNIYIKGIQNDVRHWHSPTTSHATLFRIRENVFFANFPLRKKTAKKKSV